MSLLVLTNQSIFNRMTERQGKVYNYFGKGFQARETASLKIIPAPHKIQKQLVLFLKSKLKVA